MRGAGKAQESRPGTRQRANEWLEGHTAVQGPLAAFAGGGRRRQRRKRAATGPTRTLTQAGGRGNPLGSQGQHGKLQGDLGKEKLLSAVRKSRSGFLKCLSSLFNGNTMGQSSLIITVAFFFSDSFSLGGYFERVCVPLWFFRVVVAAV